jgi:hypothetical protein|tara:strand:+ start:265 stop:720 length:456 start_codon:yes stop_codon:yes gene_type:complete
MSDVNVVQITNTYKRSQPAPTPPKNYDCLVNPLVHFSEPPCFTGCIDILNNCCNLVDLFGSIDLDSEGEQAGLSEQALNAFFWQSRLLESSLRYVSLSLRDIQAEQLEQRKKVRSSDFFGRWRLVMMGAIRLGLSCWLRGWGLSQLRLWHL